MDELNYMPADVPQPARAKFTTAFGFTVDEETVLAGMRQTVDTAKQVRDALQQKISQGMLTDVVDSQVFADGLKQKIVANLARPVIEAQQAVQTLRQPIHADLVNQIGQTIEATMPLGVVLPQLGQEGACPDCVVLRSSAAAGDLGPALECYRATALPLRGVRGLEYAQRANWIIACLPEDAEIRSNYIVATEAIDAGIVPDALSRAVTLGETRGGVFYSGDPGPVSEASGVAFTGSVDNSGKPVRPDLSVGVGGPLPAAGWTVPDGTTWDQVLALWQAGRLPA